MSNSRLEQFDKIVEIRKGSTEKFTDYWLDYSIFSSFEFWMLGALFLVPLIFLAFKIDKSKIFLIGFFGFSVHVISFYTSLIGVNMGLWNYPIQLIPQIPSLAYDASLIPVTYMLVYQWTLKNKKNYYLFAGITSMFFAFIFEPILVKMDIFKLYGDVSYLHRFISYVALVLIAKFITNVFLKLQKIS